MISTALRQHTVPERGQEFVSDPKLRLPFRSIQLFDKSWLNALLKAEDTLSSTGCFGTLYLWGESYGLRVAKLVNRLISRYGTGEEMSFGYPMGSGDIQVPVLAMRQAAAEAGVPLKLRGVTEVQKANLEKAFPGQFVFTENRDEADYVYEANKLATLSGNKLHSKKNHCNRFQKTYPDWRFEVLTKEHFPACLSLLDQWEASKDVVETEEQTAEPKAIAKAFAAYDELGLDGGILFVGEQPVAFTLGERVGGHGFDVRFEKADTAFDGAYPMINREFVRYLVGKYEDLQFINREEDMGLENLRKAKLSYKPAMMVAKYNAVWED